MTRALRGGHVRMDRSLPGNQHIVAGVALRGSAGIPPLPQRATTDLLLARRDGDSRHHLEILCAEPEPDQFRRIDHVSERSDISQHTKHTKPEEEVSGLKTDRPLLLPKWRDGLRAVRSSIQSDRTEPVPPLTVKIQRAIGIRRNSDHRLVRRMRSSDWCSRSSFRVVRVFRG